MSEAHANGVVFTEDDSAPTVSQEGTARSSAELDIWRPAVRGLHVSLCETTTPASSFELDDHQSTTGWNLTRPKHRDDVRLPPEQVVIGWCGMGIVAGRRRDSLEIPGRFVLLHPAAIEASQNAIIVLDRLFVLILAGNRATERIRGNMILECQSHKAPLAIFDNLHAHPVGFVALSEVGNRGQLGNVRRSLSIKEEFELAMVGDL